MDSKRLVSLESFKAAYCPEEDVVDSSDESASEAEEDGEWLFAEDRKRKARVKEPRKVSRKKIKPQVEENVDDLASSAKIKKLCEILEKIRTNDPTEKVIVFSQVSRASLLLIKKFTGFLDLIQPALDEKNFKFGRVFNPRLYF